MTRPPRPDRDARPDPNKKPTGKPEDRPLEKLHQERRRTSGRGTATSPPRGGERGLIPRLQTGFFRRFPRIRVPFEAWLAVRDGERYFRLGKTLQLS